MDPRLDPVIQEANDNRAFFEEFCRSLTPPQLAAPVPGSHWQARDYIAHLASIDLYVGEWFEHTVDGRRWRPTSIDDGSPFSIDTWNDARITERREEPVDALLEEAARNREALWATVERFTPAVLDQQFNFRGRDITFLRYLQLWVAHDPAHSADMLRAIPERVDPPLKEWLTQYSIPVPA
jgi:hypothetical protein